MIPLLQTFAEEKNIFIIRHGESECNKLGVIAGRKESPLTETGREQAKKTAQWLQNKNIQHIVHSPMSRCRQTAETVQQNLLDTNTPLQCSDLFIEISAGIFEGKNTQELLQTYPEMLAPFKQKSWEAIENAEKISSLVRRAIDAWEFVAKILQGLSVQNLLIVSHGGFIQWLFKTTLGLSGDHLKNWAPIVKASNCGVFSLKIEPAIDRDYAIIGAHATWLDTNRVVY